MYLIVMADSASSTEFHLPEDHRVVYNSYEMALSALKGMGNFTAILYGEVFPYEGITFKDHLDQKGYAFYGYGKDDEYSVAVGLLRLGVV
jgi:hypothetical protein